MRIKVEGSVEFHQVNQILQDLFLRAPAGAQIHGLNLYLTMRSAKGELLELLGQDGKPIDVLTYQAENLVSSPSSPAISENPRSRVVPFRRPPIIKQPLLDPIDPGPAAA